MLPYNPTEGVVLPKVEEYNAEIYTDEEIQLAINTANPQVTAFPWIDISKTNPKRIYYRICMIQYLLFTVSPNSRFNGKLKKLIEKYPTVDIAAVGFPSDWEDEPLWQYK